MFTLFISVFHPDKVHNKDNVSFFLSWVILAANVHKEVTVESSNNETHNEKLSWFKILIMKVFSVQFLVLVIFQLKNKEHIQMLSIPSYVFFDLKHFQFLSLS